MKTRLNFDWIYNIWEESVKTNPETFETSAIMASALTSAEQEHLNRILGESDICFIVGFKREN